MKNILIIDDDHNLCMLLHRFLTKHNFNVVTTYSGNDGIKKFKEQNFDLVLCDYRLDDKNGAEVLKAIKLTKPETVVIMITGYSDTKLAVEMIKLGAYDFIDKPLIPDEILSVINTALKHKDHHLQPSPLRQLRLGTNGTGNDTVPGVVNGSDIVMGTSVEIKNLFDQLDLVAPTNYSVIIYGETGAGKEVMARAIHQRSARRNHPFVALDCGTLSKELAGSELFGHMKGAFTGASNEKEGLFEMANGGTFFLDEIGNLSLDIQAYLLRVLQERKFKRVGGTHQIEVDIRILTASNEDLQARCRSGLFREDLYHRLNEFSITVPALRDRKQDIPLFAAYFLAKVNRELIKNVTGFDKAVTESFMKYHWPGNLREMVNVIRRMVLLNKSETITSKMLPLEIVQMDILSGQLKNPVKNGPANLKESASRAEYETIVAVLKEVKYNKSKAADILQIDRKTLYNKLKDYVLE